MSNNDLKQKAASGMTWTAIQRFCGKGITFISGIILARLLSPYDYGCIGMLAIFMSLAETIIDGGFGTALIQKKNPTQIDYSTIFYWNLGMSVVLYIVLFSLAPAISRFYQIPLLCPVLRVQGLILFIYAFNLVQSNLLKKKLNFRLLSIVSIGTSIISLSVTILMAYKGCGVWSLVAQNLISAAIPAIVFWFYVKWRPILAFSKKSFKELFGFGFYMFLTHIINDLASKIQGLLIGKIYSPSTMGYYSKAMGTESVASHTISKVVSQVTFPLYARVQDDKEQLTNMIRRFTTSIAYVTFPIMFILLLVAKPMFVLLYSDRWLPSVPYFQILCLVGLSSCLQAVNTQPIAAIGKSRVMFQWTFIKRVVGLVFIVGGLFLFGMKGFLIGVVLYNWSSYFVNVALVSKYIGYKWYKQLLSLVPMGLTSLFAAVVCYFLGNILNLDMYLDGIVKIIIFIIIYMGWSLIFKPDSYVYVLSIIPSKYKLWNQRHKE